MDTVQKLEIESIMKNIFSIYRLINKSIRGIRSNTYLNKGDYVMLVILERYKTLTMSEIGNKLNMVKPHVTAHINKLTKQKLVKRGYNENDRRIIYVSLTDEGREELNKMYDEVEGVLGDKIAQLSGDKKKSLEDSLATVKNILLEIIDMEE